MQIKNFRSNFPRLFEGHSVTHHLKMVCHILGSRMTKRKGKKESQVQYATFK